MNAIAAPEFWTSIYRGWRGRCPRCGAGSLFGGFLKMQANCPSCGLALEPFRADDAPAYFTILVVGHIVVPLMLVAEQHDMSTPMAIGLFLPLTLALTAGL